jgi:HSP20 family protein
MSYLMRFDPFRGLTRMQREMDRLMRTFLTPAEVEEVETGVRVPSVDIAENDTEIIVKAELPGIKKEQLEIEVLPETLSLSAEAEQEREIEGRIFRRRERVWGRFAREIPLPAEVKPDEANAKLENGLLEIHLPKTEEAKAATPKKIHVS